MEKENLSFEINCVEATKQFDHKYGEFDSIIRILLTEDQIEKFSDKQLTIKCPMCGLHFVASFTKHSDKIMAFGTCNAKGRPHVHKPAILSGNLHPAMLLLALQQLISTKESVA